MFFIYRFLINLILLISPFIFLYRYIKKKENIESFKNKLGFFTKKPKKNIIWFHGASVGEVKSIIPLMEKFAKLKTIDQILITSNTLSSLKIIKKIKINKITHQFFPMDTNHVSEKFLNYWKPQKVFFVDSEIWPNMIINLKKRDIPIYLINGRVTKKSYKRWKLFPKFSEKNFSMINLCLASSIESKNLLKKLGVKKIKYFGNLKFAQTENEKVSSDKNLKKIFKSRKIWCASSTHKNEEIICGKVHLILKKKYKNLLTVIIPRHIERCNEIKKDLENLKLKVQLNLPYKRLQEDVDIYLINSYGKTKTFFQKINNVFLGGSLVQHGGQNPLEAAIYGCNIIHGPNINNFREIYNFLGKIKIANKVNTKSSFIKKLNFFFNSKIVRNKNKKLASLGNDILKKTFDEIN